MIQPTSDKTNTMNSYNKIDFVPHEVKEKSHTEYIKIFLWAISLYYPK